MNIKKIAVIIIIIALIIVAAIVGIKVSTSNEKVAEDNEDKYISKVSSIDIFENSFDTIVPQTEVYNIINSHFSSPLPDDKTAKKAIVIGYDGCRLDVLTEINHSNGAIKYLLDTGGEAYMTYCGGAKYPEPNPQKTSTAPGWCSMLTGEWADVHKITGNGIVKSTDYPTLFTTLIEDKKIEQSAFYTSWNGHFKKKKSTYKADEKYIKENNLNVIFDYSKNDDGTKSETLADIKSESCSDFIFTILEYCDHEGHSSGYYTENDEYKNAFSQADATALELITAITERDSFDSEDWLIIITSDHGGIRKNHGSDSIQERDTFIIANKDILD